MLNIEFTKSAEKFLKKLPTKHKRQISEKIQNLLIDPFPRDTKSLKELNGFYRVDVGGYRICYLVYVNILTIALVGKRNDGEVYKKLKRLL